MVITPNKKGYLLAVAELGGGNLAKLDSFPGFTKWLDRSLIVRETAANIRYILETWPEAEWLGGAEKARDAFLAEEKKAEKMAAAKRADLPEPTEGGDGYEYRRAPMKHQRKAFLLSRDSPAFGLFMEQGTGKTKVAIDTACYLYHAGLIDMMVIVAWPNGVHRNWVDYELPEDMSVEYAADFWASNHATIKKQAGFQRVLLQRNKLRILSFNIEAFASETARSFLLEVLESNRCLFVLDQSASIKNPQAQRTKFLLQAAKLAPFRRILDGAPVAEGADELFSQFKFLDSNIIGHDTWTAFKQEFCQIGRFKEIVGYRNLPELRRRIDGYCFRVLASECLDLPERIYKRWTFDLGKEEKRIFDDLKVKHLSFFDPIKLDNSEDEFNGDYIEEHRALVKNLRLQQISSGWWPKGDEGEEGKAIEKEGPSRLKALLALLEASPGKSLIFSRFKADLLLLQRTFGKEAVSYYGGIPEEDRAEAKRRFMKDPKCLYFIGQPRSAGIGHTLTSAKNVIFYSNDPSLRLREECEKRAHRNGLKHNLHIWDLIASGTHDRKLVRALRMKKEISNMILEDPENFFLIENEKE